MYVYMIPAFCIDVLKTFLKLANSYSVFNWPNSILNWNSATSVHSLLQAMKERHQEITIHKEMLTAQVKATDEERQQISAELHERISKIDKLRKRWANNWI